jgi:hypothetical protein
MLKPLALAGAALGLLAAPALADDHGEMSRGEKKLAKMLEGREKGEPQRCIQTVGSRNLTRIDGTALTYRSGDTLWVNYTRNPDSIDDGDIMVIKRFSGSTLCRTDQIELVDRLSGMFSGVIFLDEFVPYTKVDAEG